jgi:hypothetical protein
MGRTAERGAVHPRCIVPASCSPFGGMTRITFARTVPPALLAVQPPQLLMVHDYPLALKRPMKPSIAKPPAQPRKLAQPLPKYRVVRSTAAMARRCAIRSYDKTRPPLANRKRNAQVSDGLAPGGGRHLFLPRYPSVIALSSIASAKSLFSFTFSSSRTSADATETPQDHRTSLATCTASLG